MTRQPSFLFFCADQMQSACLGIHDHPDVRTPNLDRLAREGTSFTRAYCPNPVCMPSRSSVITGLTPRGHGVISNGHKLPEQLPTFPGVLADAGYRTHAAGKLHLQPFMTGGPASKRCRAHSWESRRDWDSGRIEALPSPYYGFQTSDFVGGHVDYTFGDYRRWLDAEYPGTWDLLGREHAKARRSDDPSVFTMSIPEELHYNTWIADRSVAFLDSLRDTEPFMLWCSFPDPHFPFASVAEYRDRYDAASLTLNPTWNDSIDPTPLLANHRATWKVLPDFDERVLRECMAETYAMIEHLDACVGRVLDHLERTGRADTTVIAFIADHGEYLGTHHLVYKGMWPYEELYRVPFIWRVPGGLARGTSDELVSLLDVAPTVYDLAGIDERSARDANGTWCGSPPPLAGRSLRGHLTNGATWNDDRAVTVEGCFGGANGAVDVRTIVTDGYTLSVYAPGDDGVLFDLNNDPNERQNLWNDPDARDVRESLVLQLVREMAKSDRRDVPRISGA